MPAYHVGRNGMMVNYNRHKDKEKNTEYDGKIHMKSFPSNYRDPLLSEETHDINSSQLSREMCC
jgi:hypothetical protein